MTEQELLRKLDETQRAVDRSLERCQRILAIFGRGGTVDDLPMIAAKVMADLRGAQEEVTQARDRLKSFNSLYEKAHSFAEENHRLRGELAALREIVREMADVDEHLAKHPPTEPA